MPQTQPSSYGFMPQQAASTCAQPQAINPYAMQQQQMGAVSGMGSTAGEDGAEFFSSYEDHPPAAPSVSQVSQSGLGYQTSAPASWGYDYSSMAAGADQSYLQQQVGESVGGGGSQMTWGQDQAHADQQGGYRWDGYAHTGEMKDISF